MRSTFMVTLALLLMLCTLSTSHAQTLRRHYATQKVNQELLSQVATHAQSQRQVRQFLAKYQHRGEFALKTIPIIFHVIHNNESERISEAQIESQLDALNRDFSQEIRSIDHPAERYENFNRKQADDTYIRFCLANTPNNIHYVQSNIPEWTSDNAIKSAANGGADVVAPNQYLNVWIGKFDTQSSGYAQFPLGQAVTDGIAIDYRFFGTMGTAQAPYNEGKTLSHLVANYLGVPDIWSDQRACGDDYIYDTPIHNSPNYGCPPYKHVSTCGNLAVEMTMNLMDNTNDACQYQFTYGQRMIMTAILSELRQELLTGSNSCSEEVITAELEARNETIPSSTNTIELSLSPNPAQDQLQIELKGIDSAYEIEIHDLLGKLLYRQKRANPISIIDIDTLSEGIYVLTVTIKDERLSQQFIISRP